MLKKLESQDVVIWAGGISGQSQDVVLYLGANLGDFSRFSEINLKNSAQKDVKTA
jgi:molybdopterin biosynthesis enzyme